MVLRALNLYVMIKFYFISYFPCVCVCVLFRHMWEAALWVWRWLSGFLVRWKRKIKLGEMQSSWLLSLHIYWREVNYVNSVPLLMLKIYLTVVHSLTPPEALSPEMIEYLVNPPVCNLEDLTHSGLGAPVCKKKLLITWTTWKLTHLSSNVATQGRLF